jgi:hypothetical protein
MTLLAPRPMLLTKKNISEQFDDIWKLSQSNLKPAQILLQLQTSDNETYATNKTVSNSLQRIRRKDLAGRMPIKDLLCVLKESNWSFDVKVKDNGSIKNLFFAHPGSIHLAQINHHVALLDSTYKTNCYWLPLLHIIGQCWVSALLHVGIARARCSVCRSKIMRLATTTA